MFEPFRGFRIGEIAYFNGQRVKLIRLAHIADGCTWRVQVEDHDSRDDQQRYDIPVSMLHLLTSNPLPVEPGSTELPASAPVLNASETAQGSNPHPFTVTTGIKSHCAVCGQIDIHSNHTPASNPTTDAPCSGGCGKVRSILYSDSPAQWLCNECRISSPAYIEREREVSSVERSIRIEANNPTTDDNEASEITPVVFRKWRKSQSIGANTPDVIALFPFDTATSSPFTCQSFEHVGQHGAARPELVMSYTKPAKPSEYEALKRELESAPYNYKLKVIQRIPRNALDVRRAKLDAIVGGAQ